MSDIDMILSYPGCAIIGTILGFLILLLTGIGFVSLTCILAGALAGLIFRALFVTCLA